MAPNLLVVLLSCIPSKRWFSPRSNSEATSSRSSSHSSARRSRSIANNQEHAPPSDSPVPGIYKRVRGQVDTWLLVATRDPFDGTTTKLAEPRKVVYSKLLHRWMFTDEVAARTVWGKLPPVLVTTRTANGTSTTVQPQTSAEQRPVAYFRLEDGVTWVNHLDADGHFIISGGHARYCLVDREKGIMRPMLRGDDPVWCQSRRATPKSGLSRSSSSYRTSEAPTVKDDMTPTKRPSNEIVDPKKLRGELQKLDVVGTVQEDRRGEETATATTT